MNREQFVDVVKRVVLESTVTGTITQLSQPAGQKPDPARVELSAWFNSLPRPDRENLEKVIRLTADMAVFGMLCVLDGARAIEDGPERGTLDLRYRRGEQDVSLNDDGGDPLHDLL
jgi:hypothetical protein